MSVDHECATGSRILKSEPFPGSLTALIVLPPARRSTTSTRAMSCRGLKGVVT